MKLGCVFKGHDWHPHKERGVRECGRCGRLESRIFDRWHHVDFVMPSAEAPFPFGGGRDIGLDDKP